MAKIRTNSVEITKHYSIVNAKTELIKRSWAFNKNFLLFSHTGECIRGKYHVVQIFVHVTLVK